MLRVKPDVLFKRTTSMGTNQERIEPVGYTPKGFTLMKNKKRFIMEVLEKGKVIYKSSNFALK